MTKPQVSQSYRCSRGEVGLWPILILIAFTGGLSSALGVAHGAGESAIVTAAGLFIGLLAGLAAYFAFQTVATRLSERLPYTPDRPPTSRSELPFMLVSFGAVIGIIASINIACWLVRLIAHLAMA